MLLIIHTEIKTNHVNKRGPWCPNSSTTGLPFWRFIQFNTHNTFKAPHHWYFVRGIHRWPVGSHNKASHAKAFSYHEKVIRLCSQAILFSLILDCGIGVQVDSVGCYAFRSTDHMVTWQEAFDDCARYGKYLLAVDDDDEFNTIGNYLMLNGGTLVVYPIFIR